MQGCLFELSPGAYVDVILCFKTNSSSPPLRDLYSQFLKEMIIQPGIAKANLGVSREDVTLEDHVSAVILHVEGNSPELYIVMESGLLCCYCFCSQEYFALLAGGMVPRYQPCICVLVAFSVNYWQSTNSYEAVFSYGCIFFSLLGLTVQPVGLLGKKRGSERLLYQRDAFLGSSVHGWAQNRLRL